MELLGIRRLSLPAGLRVRIRLRQQHVPLLDEVGHGAVNVQPGERLAKDAAVGQRASGARAGGEIAEPPLKTENLPQAFDVAACERQFAEPRPLGAASIAPVARAVILRVARVVRMV